jgi:hypothetical protein
MTARPPYRGSASMVALLVVGMIVAFAGGWLVVSSFRGGGVSSGAAGAARADGTPTPSTSSSLPTDLPTGALDDGRSGDPDQQGALAAAGAAVLPKVSKVDRSPVAAFRCPRVRTPVTNAGELQDALDAARPGAVIGLADGTYAGRFVAKASGTAKKPIYLCGSRKAVIDAGGIKGGYGLHLDNASYWRVNGFTVQNAQKGVMVDRATGVGLQNLLVQHIGDEAVHLRDGTTRSVVRGLVIRDTGNRKPKFGEGVYIGSAESNWCTTSDCKPDPSNGNFVLGNRISATSSESVDIKEGTIGGVVAGNTFDGSKITGADSWVDVKGNGWLVAGNRGTRSPLDGFQTHEILDGWGAKNLFSRNSSSVDAAGFAIKVTKTYSGNVVLCDNTARGAKGGLTNITCRRQGARLP